MAAKTTEYKGALNAYVQQVGSKPQTPLINAEVYAAAVLPVSTSVSNFGESSRLESTRLT